MPLRRTAPPDPDVAARLAQVLPVVRPGWVLPAPDPGLLEESVRPADPGPPAAEDPDDWMAAVRPAHERLVQQTRAAGQRACGPGAGERAAGPAAGGVSSGATSWSAQPRPGERGPGELGPGEPWPDDVASTDSPSAPGPSVTTRGPHALHPPRRPANDLAAGAPAFGGPSSVVDLWRSGRVSPGRRGVLALGLVALLACLLTVFFVVRGRPQEVAVPSVVAAGVAVPGSTAADEPAAGDPAAGPEVVVAVGGRVRRPGIVRLPAGSRVDDAVEAAGGAVRPRDLALVNVARRLVDGEQVLVGVDAPEQPVAGAGAGAAAPGGPLDLNAATLAQLDALPGIGPVLAQRILDWRTEHGRFGSVDQLREVSGIGEATYADLQGQVRV